MDAKESRKKTLIHEALKFFARKYSTLFHRFDYEELYDEGWMGRIQKLDEDAPRSHFFNCAKQTMLDYIRKDFRQTRLLNVITVFNPNGTEVNILETIASTHNGNNAATTEQQVDERSLLNYLMATAELTERQKKILFLRFYKNMEWRAIAKELDSPSHSNIYAEAQKALILLKEIYDDTRKV